MTFFIVKQLPVIPPLEFDEKIIKFVVPRLIELVYTSWDIKSVSDDVWNDANSDIRNEIIALWVENQNKNRSISDPNIRSQNDKHGCPLPPFRWDENRRARIKAELDAVYARHYGLTTEEITYILDPSDIHGVEFPGETFRVLKEKEIRQFGEYRTKKLIMEAWETLAKGVLV